MSLCGRLLDLHATMRLAFYRLLGEDAIAGHENLNHVLALGEHPLSVLGEYLRGFIVKESAPSARNLMESPSSQPPLIATGTMPDAASITTTMSVPMPHLTE